MKSRSRSWGIVDGAVDRILCVLGAVLFSQGPEFMQQYLQRLGGHLQEAQQQLVSFENAARQVGLPLAEFAQKTRANPDPGVSHLGVVMDETSARVTELQTAHDALHNAATWERPFVFLRHLDLKIAQATGGVYRPAVPTTFEGLCYSLTGIVALLAAYHLVLKNALRLLFSGQSSPRPAPAG